MESVLKKVIIKVFIVGIVVITAVVVVALLEAKWKIGAGWIYMNTAQVVTDVFY